MITNNPNIWQSMLFSKGVNSHKAQLHGKASAQKQTIIGDDLIPRQAFPTDIVTISTEAQGFLASMVSLASADPSLTYGWTSQSRPFIDIDTLFPADGGDVDLMDALTRIVNAVPFERFAKLPSPVREAAINGPHPLRITMHWENSLRSLAGELAEQLSLRLGKEGARETADIFSETFIGEWKENGVDAALQSAINAISGMF